MARAGSQDAWVLLLPRRREAPCPKQGYYGALQLRELGGSDRPKVMQ